VKILESWIKDIKVNGFDKSRKLIDERELLRKNLENNVNTLKNALKLGKEQLKQYGNNNTKLMDEKDRLLTFGDVRIYIITYIESSKRIRFYD
jgi:hypothetical protein